MSLNLKKILPHILIVLGFVLAALLYFSPVLKGKEIYIDNIPLRALRINYVGELGWELHHPINKMKELYEIVFNEGKKFNISNFGMYAVNSLRIEKAYKGWGSELTGEISLIEADMKRFYNLDKKDNFIGADALKEKLKNNLEIKIVYLEIDCDNADAIGNEPVYYKNNIIGVTTSGGYGFRIGKSLAFAYVKAELAEAGNEFYIGILGNHRKAIVLNDMAYDSKNIRLSS